MKGPPPTGLQRWLHRRWGIVRVVVPVTSALALVLGVWILFDHQPAQAFGVLISGAVIASSFFSFRGAVGYVEKYDRTPP
jgi:hypothetical protein